MNQELKQATVLLALRHMFASGHFSICTVDNCAKILEVRPDGLEAYTILRALHCIDFRQMPSNVRQEIPRLIGECLQSDCIVEAEFAEPPSKPKGFFARLTS